MVIGIPFWQSMDWSQTGDITFWEKNRDENLLSIISAFLFVMFLGVALAAILALRISLYLRQFNILIRRNIERVLNTLAFMPCLVWALLYVPSYINLSGTSLVFNVIIGFVTLFSMSFPMLLFLFFQQINDVPDSIRQAGFALGANSNQIAQKLILPQKTRMIVIDLFLVYVRLMIEIGVVFMVLNVISVNVISISIILFLIFLSVLVLLYWGRNY